MNKKNWILSFTTFLFLIATPCLAANYGNPGNTSEEETYTDDEDLADDDDDMTTASMSMGGTGAGATGAAKK